MRPAAGTRLPPPQWFWQQVAPPGPPALHWSPRRPPCAPHLSVSLLNCPFPTSLTAQRRNW